MDAPCDRSSPHSLLLGPRSPLLAVSKDSHKVRKPPVAAQRQQQPPAQNHHQYQPQHHRAPQQQQRAPVIIYDASPKVIHTKPPVVVQRLAGPDFKALVQRLVGPGFTSQAQFDAAAAGGAGLRPSAAAPPRAPMDLERPPEFQLSSTAKLSPAAKLAAIERSVRPLLPHAHAPAPISPYYSGGGGGDDDFLSEPLLADIDAFEAALGAPPGRPGILSLAALPPAAYTGLFSRLPFDPVARLAAIERSARPLPPQLCLEPTCAHHDPARALGALSGIKNHLSASAPLLFQKAMQRIATSSSSSLINTQARVEEDKFEDIIRRSDGKHGGIIRRENEKNDIIELIMSHHPSKERFTIICIIGGHGLGKTTLASLVYWDNSMSRSFEARAWMCLSDVCDYEGLLRSVVASLTGVSCGLNERDELEELVREELVGKKFFFVLDDLHDDNVGICRHLIPLLSCGDKGSAVMVTTSSNMAAGNLGTAHAYSLKPFMNEEFLSMAKPNFLEYSALESIINRVPSHCYGFPMFAKAIHGILYSAFTLGCLNDWLGDTVDSKLTEILSKTDNPLHDLLYLSYSYLGPNQKRCLEYCSMFPRDYTYNKEQLLRLWMSQGFITPEREEDGNGDCEDAFHELLQRSFFDHCPSSELKEQKYVMHDSSSRLAWSASGDKFFRAHDRDLSCIPKDVHHLSIVPQQCDSEICFSPFTEFKDLSTFLLVYNSQLDSFDSQFHVMDVRALDECFRNFRCLKTLDLSHTDIKELPESIGYMTSLCFLGLNNTNLRKLPNSVCDLSKLQTLELQDSAFLIGLPTDIKNLNNLYHLDASKEHGLIYIPPGIGQLTSLRTLTTFTVGGVSWDCKLSELEHLNSLKGCLHIQSLDNVENAEDANRACLAAKKLRKLSLEWCHSGEDVESNDHISVAEQVLDALQPYGFLEELNIKGYYGLEFPIWMADQALSKLVSITLDNCFSCEKLPPLGVLPVLRCLFIQNLRGIQNINYEFYGTTNRNCFPKLEILKLRDMYNLQDWCGVWGGDFPLLHSLSIERCPKLHSIPPLQFISDVSIMSCSKMSLPGLQNLQTLKVGSLKQRESFALPSELRSLLTLEVICCEDLCSLDGLSVLQSLKCLKFRSCPRLKFDEDEPLPDTLDTVDIHSNCDALSNWRPNGFEELLDASDVYRRFIRQKCEGKGIDDAVMQSLEAVTREDTDDESGENYLHNL